MRKEPLRLLGVTEFERSQQQSRSLKRADHPVMLARMPGGSSGMVAPASA
jgi:hypothetical protein